jgi:drug/metabolite transporter (DMT)-like permease
MNSNTEERSERPAGEGASLWQLITGPTIWAVQFVVCYPLAAVFCAKLGRTASLVPVRWLVLGISITALVGLLLLFISAWRVRQPSVTEEDLTFEANSPEERHRFLTHVTLTLTTLSIVGVIYTTIPVFVVDTCR